MHWEYRTTNKQDASAIEKTIAEHLEGGSFAAVRVANTTELDVPPFRSHLGEDSMRVLAEFGAKLPASTVPFGSEAGIFERSQIPAVVCGPGSIDQAHRPDEWIAGAALEEADRFMSKLGEWAARTRPD